MKIETWPVDKPKPYDKNPRIIPDSAVDKVAMSLREYGWNQPIVVDKDGIIIAGHTRLRAAKKLGLAKVPVYVADLPEEKARAYRLADNRTNQEAEWDDAVLLGELGLLRDIGFDLELTGFDPDELADMFGGLGDGPGDGAASSPGLADKFMIPPFSVLNAREGWWQDRKRAWLAIGIQSEVGRGQERLEMAHPATTATIDFYAQKRAMEAETGKKMTTAEAKAQMAKSGTVKDDRSGNAARLANKKAAR